MGVSNYFKNQPYSTNTLISIESDPIDLAVDLHHKR
jgi:hypothetical protein